MQISDFDYLIPEHLIAQEPLKNRSLSRLMHVHRKSGKIEHKRFIDFPELVDSRDLLVFNQSKVMKARLLGVRATGGQVEIFLLKNLGGNCFEALLNATAKQKVGMEFGIGEGFRGRVLSKVEDSMVFRVEFSVENGSFEDMLERYGTVPLPPYIKRAPSASDRIRYQTVYAKEEGSVAAPTAGLHFDEATLKDLKKRNIEYEFVTLHVGLGTFQPIKCENFSEHRMHTESFNVPVELQNKIKKMKSSKIGKVVAVGTTALRSLESAARDIISETDIFIKPGDTFLWVDKLFTNFHQPRSTLIVLLAAFLGDKKLLDEVYTTAVREKYRFFSYGDCMFIE